MHPEFAKGKNLIDHLLGELGVAVDGATDFSFEPIETGIWLRLRAGKGSDQEAGREEMGDGGVCDNILTVEGIRNSLE